MDANKVASILGVDIPELVIKNQAEGLDGNPFGELILRGRLLLWVSLQPNISQGGISISYTDAQRLVMQREARTLFKRAGATDDLESLPTEVTYGYKGDKL